MYILHVHINTLCFTVVLLFLGDPNKDPKILSDPFKTLFVGRIVSLCVHFPVNIST